MKKIIRLTESDLTRLIKRVLKENNEDPNTHRYDTGVQSPGIEQFLKNPLDPTIENGLMNQLRNDPYGKGKIVIIFNDVKFKEIGSFIQKIQSDYRNGRCYEITNYEYNNRIIINTQITILAKQVECKKPTSTKPNGETKIGGDIKPKTGDEKTPKPKPKCKYRDFFDKDKDKSDIEINLTPESIKRGQQYCYNKTKFWKAEYDNGYTRECTSNDIDGKVGCCTTTCYKYLRQEEERNKDGRKNYSKTKLNT